MVIIGSMQEFVRRLLLLPAGILLQRTGYPWVNCFQLSTLLNPGPLSATRMVSLPFAAGCTSCAAAVVCSPSGYNLAFDVGFSQSLWACPVCVPPQLNVSRYPHMHTCASVVRLVALWLCERGTVFCWQQTRYLGFDTWVCIGFQQARYRNQGNKTVKSVCGLILVYVCPEYPCLCG